MAVLWEQRDCDSRFLFNLSTPLQVNPGWRRESLVSLMRASLGVSVQVSATAIFLLASLCILDDGSRAPLLGALLAAACTGALVCVRVCLAHALPFAELCRSALALLSILYVLTPVLASLAQPVSDDTVRLVVGLLLLVHVVSYDYFAASWARFRAPVSANSGLLSAVLLCSRASSYAGAVAILALGLVVFALWPMFCTHLCIASRPQAPTWLFFILAPATAVAMYVQYPKAIPVYAAALLVINVAAPLLFRRLRRMRHVLVGQWTEATVEAGA